jgi:putative NADPH-quinone reductase
MERRTFIKSSLAAAAGLALSNSKLYGIMKENSVNQGWSDKLIEKVSEGSGKKILVLMSAWMKNGNTDRVTDSFIKGAVENGHSVTKVYLGAMSLRGCRGCGACLRNGHHCVVNDDMQKLYPLFAWCDMIVMASPVYFWTITASLKAFIERLYAISVNDQYPTKELILLMTAGLDNKEVFAHGRSYAKTFAMVLGKEDIVGSCLAGGCVGCEGDKMSVPQHYIDEAYQLGHQIR